jgi:hypothetical protein
MVVNVNLDPEIRGDTVIYDLTLSRVGASPGWMSGGSVSFMAKFKVKDADVDAVFSKSTPFSGIVWVDQSSATPTATLTILPADYPAALLGKDKTLLYEVQITDSAGRVETPQRGTLVILADVDRGA